MTIYIGGDASKGYADFHMMDESGTMLCQHKLDDSSRGHGVLHQWLTNNTQEKRVLIGLESSGGVEKNWLRGLQELSKLPMLQVFLVNPLAVKKSREALRLHESVTDPSSARAVAEYLQMMDGKLLWEDNPVLEEARRLEAYISSQIKHVARLKIQLQQLVVNTHPELARYSRLGFAGWMLTLLEKYPTSQELAKARPEDLALIPYLVESRAEKIIQAAGATVASTRTKAASYLVRELAREISRMTQKVKELLEELHAPFLNDPIVALYLSIPGVGLATAVYLRLSIGDCRRFRSSAAVVAFCGLDPRIHNSGDTKKNLRISKRGHSRIRALLFQCAKAAIRSAGPFRTFYERLVGRGKPKMVALIAVMAKMLRVAYAIQLKQQPFNGSLPVKAIVSPTTRTTTTVVECEDAPVSRRESNRRKKAANASNEVEPQEERTLAAVGNGIITCPIGAIPTG